MPGKDYPDWGGYPSSSETYPLKDLAEAVVRLGSPVIYDRAGATAFIEDFEFGLGRVLPYYTVGDVAPLLVTDMWNSKGFALAVQSFGLLGYETGVTIRRPLMSSSLWGASVRIAGRPRLYNVGIRINVHHPGVRHQYEVYWQASEDLMYYLDSDGVEQELGAIVEPYEHEQNWSFFKVVIDPVNQLYNRVVFNSQSFTDIDQPAQEIAAAATEMVQFDFYIMSDTGVLGALVYLDDIIITYNEP